MKSDLDKSGSGCHGSIPLVYTGGTTSWQEGRDS